MSKLVSACACMSCDFGTLGVAVCVQVHVCIYIYIYIYIYAHTHTCVQDLEIRREIIIQRKIWSRWYGSMRTSAQKACVEAATNLSQMQENILDQSERYVMCCVCVWMRACIHSCVCTYKACVEATNLRQMQENICDQSERSVMCVCVRTCLRHVYTACVCIQSVC